MNTYGASLGLDLEEQIAQNRARVPLTQSALTRRRGGPLWVAIDRVENGVYRALRAAGHTKLPPVKQLVDLSLLDETYARGIAN